MDREQLRVDLSDPFDPSEVKWKPQTVKNNRCLAIAYIDSRLVQDRLDGVVGVENWQDEYHFLPDGSVVCQLRLHIGGEWVTKTDVGSPSEQPDAGDRVKAAVSDALKRAAVKWGVGRYLHRLPHQWVDYDPVKKQITQPPQLPEWAKPGGKRATPAGEKPPATEGVGAVRTRIKAAKSLQELGAVWTPLSGDVKRMVLADKDRRKAELSAQSQQQPDPPPEDIGALRLRVWETIPDTDLTGPEFVRRFARELGCNPDAPFNALTRGQLERAAAILSGQPAGVGT